MALWVVFSAVAITTAWKESEIIWLFLSRGVLIMLLKAQPKLTASPSVPAMLPGLTRLVSGVHGAVALGAIGTLFLFFVKAGAFVFGSGLAIVPFHYGGVVEEFHWLTERPFMDAVAVAMIAPGPIVITAASSDALLPASWAQLQRRSRFSLPFYSFVLIGAPYYRRFATVPQVKAFVQRVNAAAVGAIAGSAHILAGALADRSAHHTYRHRDICHTVTD